jgi:putative membrane protein
MIVYPKRMTWLRSIFRWRESVAYNIWRRVLATTLISVGTTLWQLNKELPHLSLTALPFTFIGLALSIFLGFRNSTSYDRFWEGRKLWGQLVNASRTFTRQIQTVVRSENPSEAAEVQQFQRDFVYFMIAYVHAFRMFLRKQSDFHELDGFIPEGERKILEKQVNPPLYLLKRMSEKLQTAYQRGWIHTFHLPMLEQHLTEFTAIQGGCERIANTPIPHSYLLMLHQLVGIYCFALPFGITDTVGLATPLVVLLVSYAFLGLDAIGDAIENPFELDPEDLPLGSISRNIEIVLRQQLGETHLPEALVPNAYYILD